MDLGVIWQVHLWGAVTHGVRWGVPDPQGIRDLGPDPQPKHATANCSSMLPPDEYKQAIPPFVKLVWSLLLLLSSPPASVYKPWHSMYVSFQIVLSRHKTVFDVWPSAWLKPMLQLTVTSVL